METEQKENDADIGKMTELEFARWNSTRASLLPGTYEEKRTEFLSNEVRMINTKIKDLIVSKYKLRKEFLN